MEIDYPTNGKPTNGNLIGPSPGAISENEDSASTPHSPYTTTRTLIHNLTLPPNPNFNIPPSPPGSPPPGMDQKLSHFLSLKNQGVHFNAKLAQSSALKNPSLLQKLMHFAGVEERNQYATTLPKDIWDPSGFPDWAFKEELARSQQDILKRREDAKAKEQRESIDFVSSSSKGGASDSGARGLRGSVAERVMAGLDRERTRSPMVDGSSLRTEGFQHRPNPKKRSRSR